MPFSDSQLYAIKWLKLEMEYFTSLPFYDKDKDLLTQLIEYPQFGERIYKLCASFKQKMYMWETIPLSSFQSCNDELQRFMQFKIKPINYGIDCVYLNDDKHICTLVIVKLVPPKTTLKWNEICTPASINPKTKGYTNNIIITPENVQLEPSALDSSNPATHVILSGADISEICNTIMEFDIQKSLDLVSHKSSQEISSENEYEDEDEEEEDEQSPIPIPVAPQMRQHYSDSSDKYNYIQDSQSNPAKKAKLDDGMEWIQNYECLKEYGKMPAYKKSENSPLYYWCKKQRKLFDTDELSEDRINLLEKLSFWRWIANDSLWEKRFNQLRQFVEKNNRLPIKTEKGTRIGEWVNQQRYKYKNGKLGDYRIKKLNSIPKWVWSHHSHVWETNYKNLQKHVEEFGKLPTTENNKKLFAWCDAQRYYYKTSKKYSQYRIDALEAIPGWQWNPKTSWNENFLFLQRYLSEHGKIPPQSEHKELYKWINQQKEDYGANKLSPTRIDKLNSLCLHTSGGRWTWNETIDWEEYYLYVKEFVRVKKHIPYSHSSIKFNYTNGTSRSVDIGAWCVQQKEKKDELKQEQKEKLENLEGWEW